MRTTVPNSPQSQARSLRGACAAIAACAGGGCISYNELATYPGYWPPYADSTGDCRSLSGTFHDLGTPGSTNETYEWGHRIGQRYSLTELLETGQVGLDHREYRDPAATVTLLINERNELTATTGYGPLTLSDFTIGCERGALTMRGEQRFNDALVRRRDVVASLRRATDGSLILEYRFSERAYDLAIIPVSTIEGRYHYIFSER